MNTAEETIEEELTEPSFTFIPRNDDDPIVSSIDEIAIEKLTKFKMAKIRWKEENKQIETYFVPVNTTSKTYNKRTKNFKLKRFFDEEEHTIASASILQFCVITEEDVDQNKEGAQHFIEEAKIQKEKYQDLIQTYNISPDIFLKEKKDFYSAIYQMPFEELANIDKCKEFLMNYVQVVADKEIENVKNEFATANSTGEHQDSQELEHIIEFLANVKQDYSIFNEAGDYETILKCWPIIIQPSYFSLFQNYIDRYYLINRNND